MLWTMACDEAKMWTEARSRGPWKGQGGFFMIFENNGKPFMGFKQESDMI